MGIVPSVVAPVFDAADEILDSIAVEVGQPPLVVPQPPGKTATLSCRES
jgi:hypothetical protein